MTDLNPQLNSQGILAAQPQTGTEPESENFDASTSVGASINESLMMPTESLAAGLPDLQQPLGLSADDDSASEEAVWQKQIKAMDQKIRQNPYPYIAGALGLGLILAKSLSLGRNHSIS
ncbi:MAG: hypothetical protein M3Q07_14365 [Pseudobdellovibrionaceae bacterium]|nr:hypothetical protein [Pseudobdellovibrionaceae bacterium]